MVNKGFKYPIELDHAALKRYSSVLVGLMQALSDIEGEKTGVAYRQECNKERMTELATKEYSPIYTTDYRILIESEADALADRMKQLDKASVAMTNAKEFLNDLLQ